MALITVAVQLGVSIGLWAINKYILNEKPKLEKPSPRGLEFAQNTIGTPVPIVYGRVRIDNPILVWVGGRGFEVEGDALSYQASLLLVLGVPPSEPTEDPALLGFWYGDKEHGLSMLHEQEQPVSLVLGDGGELRAMIQFFDGRTDQLITSYPSAPTFEIDHAFDQDSADRSRIPGYRRQMLMAFIAGNGDPPSHYSLGHSARIPQIGVEVMARGRLADDYVSASDPRAGANPAFVLLDLLSTTVHKLNIPLADIDEESFEAAADVLQAEHHMCSLIVYRDEDAPQLMAGLSSRSTVCSSRSDRRAS